MVLWKGVSGVSVPTGTFGLTLASGGAPYGPGWSWVPLPSVVGAQVIPVLPVPPAPEVGVPAAPLVPALPLAPPAGGAPALPLAPPAALVAPAVAEVPAPVPAAEGAPAALSGALEAGGLLHARPTKIQKKANLLGDAAGTSC